jgi:sporulation protein YlmC with PRC-barrel domain
MDAGHVGMVALGEADLVLADPADDVRGLTVMDGTGHRVGEVDEIVVDEQERRARLLVVASGGVLGFGARRSLVPVETVAHVDADFVLLQGTEEERKDAPYDPALIDPPDYAGVYSLYGLTPFWHAGYRRPYFHGPH